jgi:RNA polymerase sigma factor (TIGR02999 family)
VDELLPLVYNELRQMACRKMAGEPEGHTPQPTALVHEAWLRLGANDQPRWQSRAHFFGAAGEAMRRILVERARRRLAAKRGGGLEPVELDKIELPAPVADDDALLRVDEALEKLAAVDPRKAELVKLRYFVGMTFEETASVLGITVPVAKQWWAYARAWLSVELGSSTPPPKLMHLVRGDLDWIVMKCLEKDRSRRYETANGLAADLTRHLANEPVVARPPGAGYRLQKAFRRNRLLFISGITVIAALWIATVVSSWQVFETRKARNAEQKQRLAAQNALREAERAQAAERQERLRADSEKLIAQRHLYTANMNLAQLAWDQSNLGRLRQLLDEEIAYPDRGFEWYYWHGQMHLELRTVRSHGAAITSVAISPDNRRMVTASSDQTARIWDWASGETLNTLAGHTSAIWSVAFSPDGRRVVTGSDDRTAKVWDTESGRELLTLKGHIESIPAVAFSPDGQRIVTASRDSTVKVWDAATGVELKTLRGLRREVYAVAFSPDGGRVAAGGADYVTKVWDVDNGRELLTLGGHDLMIWCGLFHGQPTGRYRQRGSNRQGLGSEQWPGVILDQRAQG